MLFVTFRLLYLSIYYAFYFRVFLFKYICICISNCKIYLLTILLSSINFYYKLHYIFLLLHCFYNFCIFFSHLLLDQHTFQQMPYKSVLLSFRKCCCLLLLLLSVETSPTCDDDTWLLKVFIWRLTCKSSCFFALCSKFVEYSLCLLHCRHLNWQRLHVCSCSV